MGGEGEELPPPLLNLTVGALALGSGAKSGGGCRRRRERAGEGGGVCVCVFGGSALTEIVGALGRRDLEPCCRSRGRVGYGGGGAAARSEGLSPQSRASGEGNAGRRHERI
jgi:hypothetical protein